MLPNFPISKEDIQSAEDILGPNFGSLKVKTTRKKPSCVILNTCNELPQDLISRHGNVAFAINIMYIIGIAFFMNI